jgi:hypothetical protein
LAYQKGEAVLSAVPPATLTCVSSLGETYPTDTSGTMASLSYTFDNMGRLNTLTDTTHGDNLIAGASYGPANELLSITGGTWSGETLTYNSLKQVASLSSYIYPNSLSITYSYPTTNNNGKIISQTDNVRRLPTTMRAG